MSDEICILSESADGADRLESKAVFVQQRELLFRLAWDGSVMGAFLVELSTNGKDFEDRGLPNLPSPDGINSGSGMIHVYDVAPLHARVVFEGTHGAGCVAVWHAETGETSADLVMADIIQRLERIEELLTL